MGNDPEKSSMLEVLENDESPKTDSDVMLDSLRIDIERTLNSLDPKSRDIIKLYFGIGYSYPRSMEEIGHKYQLTKERVRQIKEKSIRKIKASSRVNLLKPYI